MISTLSFIFFNKELFDYSLIHESELDKMHFKVIL